MMENILIVDDEESILEIMAETMTRWGYNPITANSSEDAIAKASTTPIDLLLTDFRLPAKNGIDLIKDIKTVDPATKAIMFTGYAGVDSAVDAFKAGVSDYLVKPVDLAELHQKIEKELKEKRASGSFRTLKSLNWGMLISVPIWLLLGLWIAHVLSN